MNFNPRTREGCDPQLSLHAGQCRPDFNPRTREGCDDDSEEIGIEVIHISIHAPVKGATLSPAPVRLPHYSISIHAPVKGATIYKPLNL